jgi:hypothetical protein
LAKIVENSDYNIDPREIKAGNKTELGLILHCLLVLVRSLPKSLSDNAFFAKGSIL